MNEKLLAVKELEEQLWWWRHEENRSELKNMKDFGYELAARNYELMRRCPIAKSCVGFDQNFLKLNREDKTTASVAWINRDKIPFRHCYDPFKEEIGWTSPSPHYLWNLKLSDRILLKAFLDYINLQRTLKKITRISSKGNKNRPPTWLYIECLDMRLNEIENLDDSQRGMASKASELAVQFFDEFKLAEIKKDEMAKKYGWDIGEIDGFSQVLYDEHDNNGETDIESSQ